MCVLMLILLDGFFVCLFFWHWIFFIQFRIFAVSLFWEKELFVFVLHSSSPYAYSLIQFLGLAIWECSSEPGLRQGKFELLSISDNGAITDPATEPKVWFSF